MKKRNGKLNKKAKNNLIAYSFIMPDLFGLMVFIIIPILFAIYISLFKWNFANTKVFVGLQNYATMFQDQKWWMALLRTLKLSLMYVPSLFILALFLAVLISYVGNRRASGFIKTAFLLPYAITSVIASSLWMFIFMEKRGFLNVFLNAIGVEGQKFLGSTNQAMGCIVIVLLWINLGYNIILFLSAIKDIPKDYLEAARIDGASRIQVFWRITFPLIKQTSIFVLITTTIASFQCLDLIMVMTSGGPASSTEVASLYIYMQSFSMLKAGYGSTLSVVLFLILAAFAMVQLKLISKRD